MQTESLAAKSKDATSLEAKQLARRQRELARLAEKWQARLADYAARELDHSATANEALRMAGEQGLTTNLGSAADAAQAGKIGAALAKQQLAEETFTSLLDALAGISDTGEAQLQVLRDTAKMLEELLKTQQGISAEADPEKKPTPVEKQRLEDRQRDLAEKTQVAVKRTAAASASAGEATQAAANSMRQAAASSAKNDVQSAAAQAKQAEEKLAAAKQAIQNELAKREAELLQAQLIRWEQFIQGFLLRQRALKQETSRLEALAQSQQNQLSSAQQSTLLDLSGGNGWRFTLRFQIPGQGELLSA